MVHSRIFLALTSAPYRVFNCFSRWMSSIAFSGILISRIFQVYEDHFHMIFSMSVWVFCLRFWTSKGRGFLRWSSFTLRLSLQPAPQKTEAPRTGFSTVFSMVVFFCFNFFEAVVFWSSHNGACGLLCFFLFFLVLLVIVVASSAVLFWSNVFVSLLTLFSMFFFKWWVFILYPQIFRLVVGRSLWGFCLFCWLFCCVIPFLLSVTWFPIAGLFHNHFT